MKPLTSPYVLLTVAVGVLGGTSTGLAQATAVGEHAEHHAAHRSLRDNVRHRGNVILDTPYRTTPHVRHFLARTLDQYRFLAAALVEGDADRADRAAAAMRDAVQSVPVDAFRAEGARAWRDHAHLYEELLVQVQHESELSAKRSYFAHLSEVVYCTVKSFGLGAELPEVLFCPMALDGKGAYWLSDSDQIENPYMGAAMPECGQRSETLGP